MPKTAKEAEELYSLIVNEYSQLNENWRLHVKNVADEIGDITSLDQAYFIVHYALLFQKLSTVYSDEF